ncbi:ABC transporter permease [Clostridium sp. FP2]|uniref:ABC transporter permease n=1 Tax=Clostridium sp. FP2 TaxID=2724481 RepID=UPI0013E997F5|nr:ABC transporter permease [Clostridium sp. FP2]MBZ9623152.1 ABC transporter permease [Clostridium sp. FP2]
MSFLHLVSNEFKKTKGSKIILLLIIAPLLMAVSGVSSLKMYLSENYVGAWSAMFVQSALGMAYFLIPLSMIVLCVLLSQLELKNNGILKMLALPVSRAKLASAKLVVLISYLGVQLFIFFLFFIVAGLYTTHVTKVSEGIPVLYILKWSAILMLSAIPEVTIMWMITTIIEKPILSMGLNLLFVIPAVLVGITTLWTAYPFCYSGVMVSIEMQRIAQGLTILDFDIYKLLLCAIPILISSVLITLWRFGKNEMT